jgi:hypothetical protein
VAGKTRNKKAKRDKTKEKKEKTENALKNV